MTKCKLCNEEATYIGKIRLCKSHSKILKQYLKARKEMLEAHRRLVK